MNPNDTGNLSKVRIHPFLFPNPTFPGMSDLNLLLFLFLFLFCVRRGARARARFFSSLAQRDSREKCNDILRLSLAQGYFSESALTDARLHVERSLYPQHVGGSRPAFDGEDFYHDEIVVLLARHQRVQLNK